MSKIIAANLIIWAQSVKYKDISTLKCTHIAYIIYSYSVKRGEVILLTVEDRLRKAIKEEREKKGITQTKLAESVGISTSFICDIEAGRKNPSITTLALIAKHLGLSLDNIFLN